MKTGISASRFAPAENTSSGDQITRPAYSRSASLDRLRQPLGDERADEVQLGGDAGDQHLAVERPDAHFVVPVDLGAALQRRRRARAGDALAERAGGGRPASRSAARSALARRAPRAFGRVHDQRAVAASAKTQSGSGMTLRLSALPASMSSLTHCATCCQPASCHSSNGPCCMPKPQRIAKSTSRAVCRRCRLQVDRGVVEAVAQDPPTGTAPAGSSTRAAASAASGGGLLQDAGDDLVGLAAARSRRTHRLLAGVEAQDVLADPLVEAGARLLAERALLDQAAEDRRRRVAR